MSFLSDLNPNYFEISNVTATFDEAKNACENKGKTLAKISSAKDEVTLKHLIDVDRVTGITGVWIGEALKLIHK